MDYTIDIMPILIGTYEFLKPTLTIIIMFLAALAIEKVRKHFKLKSEILSNDRLQAIMARGIAFGLSRIEASLKDRKLEINTKSQVLKLAADYAATAAPDTLKKFDITPERLAELVEAKLGEMQVKTPEAAPSP